MFVFGIRLDTTFLLLLFFFFLPFYLSPFYDVLRLMTLFVSKTEQTVCNIISYLVDTWAFTFTSVSTIKYNFYQYCTCDLS